MAYHLRVKICGVTNEADALHAGLSGADAVGLNFFPASPRYVNDPATIARILIDLPPFVEAVGVFANQSWRSACHQAKRFGRLRTVQLHGDHHEPGFTYPFKRIEAFKVRDRGSLLEINRYLELAHELGQMPSAVLVDAHVPGQHGGTGQTVPWELLASFQPGVPLILAGGLTPDNVAEAVRVVRPYAVDVASGVEHSPGHKDPDKVRRFIDNARAAAAK
jgi:phosphoribosylanthranilate isomerase